MSYISAGTTTTTSLVQGGDTTGNLVIATGSANTTAVTISSTQNATFANTVSTTGNITTAANVIITGSMRSVNTFGYENRLINGGMTVSQRATGATITAGTAVPTASAGYYTADRWFMYSVGANATANTVAGSGNVLNNTQITGAASITAIGIGQRIEQRNSIDLANSTCTLSVNMSNSLLTTVTWTASYANTADTFGTIGTPTKTQIATGTFTVTSTLTNYVATMSVPAAATTGIEILFTVGAQTSGTWVIGQAQFEKGGVSTLFDFRDYGRELILCQRYFQTYTQPPLRGVIASATVANRMAMVLPVVMRVAPTAVVGALPVYDGAATTTVSSVITSYLSVSAVELDFNLAGSLTAFRPAIVYQTGSSSMTLAAEVA